MCNYSFSKKRFDKVQPLENALGDYYVANGCFCIPTCRLNAGLDCAPTALSDNNEVLPDWLIFQQDGSQYFVELKCADSFPFNRKHNTRVLGIKRAQWLAYQSIRAKTRLPVKIVWLLGSRFAIVLDDIQGIEPIGCLCQACKSGQHHNCQADDLVYVPKGLLKRDKALEAFLGARGYLERSRNASKAEAAQLSA